MFNRRAITLGAALVASAACLAQAAVAATSKAPVRVNLVVTSGVSLGNSLTLPSVSVAPVNNLGGAARNVAGTGISVTASTSAASTGRNAQLTIRGQPGDVVSTTVPESFTVVRSGGEETLIVKTNTNAEYSIGNGDVVLNGDAMSVDIGGSLALASAQNLVPGPYEGMLVVVVQYN